MTDILIVKTSSMGDVVHNLPIIADIKANYPDAHIDWVVEEGFKDIVSMHPEVREVIPVAWRRWRKTLLSKETWSEIRDFRYRLKRKYYDYVIDTQGLIKSAIITKMANAQVRVGYAKEVAREPFAARFYDETFTIPRNAHAVERNRWLASAALNYYMDENRLDYGLSLFSHDKPLETSYVVLLHATSRADKEWPIDHWIGLGTRLNHRGLKVIFPWGNEQEKARANGLKEKLPNATVLPKLSLKELAQWLANSEITVGVDTGLVHLSAALGRPTLGLYMKSSPLLTGLYAKRQTINLGDIDQMPTVDEVEKAIGRLLKSSG